MKNTFNLIYDFDVLSLISSKSKFHKEKNTTCWLKFDKVSIKSPLKSIFVNYMPANNKLATSIQNHWLNHKIFSTKLLANCNLVSMVNVFYLLGSYFALVSVSCWFENTFAALYADVN